MTLQARQDQTAHWIPLLRTLTDAAPSWTVWKNVEDGLTGEGDVDFLAPARDWHAIEHEFLRWARHGGLGPVVVCRHVPGAMFLIALPAQDGRWFQLDVRDRVTWRGSLVLRAVDVGRFTEMDERGFRRMRAGAEGAIKLMVSGAAPGGRAKPKGLRREGVVELLRRDPESAADAARLFGPVRAAALRGIEAATRGEWDRGAMAAVEAFTLARAPLDPGVLAAQAWTRRAKRRCVVLRTGIGGGRRITGSREAWLELVARTHIVHGWSVPDA